MYGGSVISCSTQERAAVLIEPSEGLSFEVAGQRCEIHHPDDLHPDGGFFDVAKAIVHFLDLGQAKFSLRWACNVPFAAGLSSSSAMSVSILNAIFAFQSRNEHPFYRAEMARHIELNYMALCGYQDAYMCTFGGLNYMDFHQKQFYRAFGDEPYATIESLQNYVPEYPFILAHTGVKRSSGTVHVPIRERWLEGDKEVTRCYLRIAHLARMGKRALLQSDWTRLGQLMVENHEIQRDLGGSGPENDALIQAALDGGALGAKLAGAGGGGTIIALTQEPESVIEAITQTGPHRILYPRPAPGVTITALETDEDMAKANKELAQRAQEADIQT